MPVRQLLTFSDLPGLGSSPDSVRQAFDRIYNKNPDGIALNDETYFDAVTPPITKTWGHPCYKVLGTFTYDEGVIKDNGSLVIGSQYAINNSDEDATISLQVTGSFSKTTSVSSSVTAGMSFTEEFSIEGVFKLGSTFSVSTTAGQSTSNSESLSQTATVSVTVPPKSKKKVSMVGTLKQETVNFSAPIDASGMFGANFPDRVNGHYFWFQSAGAVLAKTSGTITGTISQASVFDVQTEIGSAEAI